MRRTGRAFAGKVAVIAQQQSDGSAADGSVSKIEDGVEKDLSAQKRHPIGPDEKGKIDPAKLRPITFDPVHNDYLVIGGKVGDAFKDGMKLKG